MSIRNQLLAVLSDGRFHAGEELGRQFRVTRTAIWKQIQTLKQNHIDIDAVPGRGYRLTDPVELLDREAICAALPDDTADRLEHLYILQQVDSTNRYLMQQKMSAGEFVACLAEGQTAGRGRRGRDWQSPYGRNIYLSLLWRLPFGVEALAGFGLAVGVAVLRVVHQAGVAQARLKWPNDIIVGARKLAGILLEVSGETSGTGKVVIGIGLNVQMPASAAHAIEQPWIDMNSVLSTRPSRNVLAASLITQLCRATDDFKRDGLDAFLDTWRQYDGLNNRAVVLETGGQCVEGICRGVDVNGALMLEHDGSMTRYQSGDVSIRTFPATGKQDREAVT